MSVKRSINALLLKNKNIVQICLIFPKLVASVRYAELCPAP